MGKAVNLMNSGGRATGVVVPENKNATITTGGGGIPASLKIKAAGAKPASVTNTGLDQPKQKANEKINNLF